MEKARSNFESLNGRPNEGDALKRQTCPVTLQHEDEYPVTPKKKSEEDDELLLDASDSDQEDSASEQSEDEEKAEKAKAEELEKMKEFAAANGFELTIEDKEKDPRFTDGGVFRLTKEELEEFHRKDLQKAKDEMKNIMPVAEEIMTRKYTNLEPVRTGFNQSLLPLNIRNNFEIKRAPQGPQIIVTSQSAMKKRERDIKSRENSSRGGRRSVSRESSMSRGAEVPGAPVVHERVARQGEEQAEGEQVEKVVAQPVNNETSLRHLFYMEYKRNFPEGQTNPIVYSRYGKQHYASDEKFDTANFNQLVRTCNLKKLLKFNENLCTTKDKKFNDPVSLPCGDYYRPKDEKDKTLIFESRFESGNLQLANKISDNEYDLVLQNDINSKGHTQWFFYRVANTKKGQKVKFNMLNMIKSKSLYNDGMKVLIYSEKRQDIHADNREELGW